MKFNEYLNEALNREKAFAALFDDSSKKKSFFKKLFGGKQKPNELSYDDGKRILKKLGFDNFDINKIRMHAKNAMHNALHDAGYGWGKVEYYPNKFFEYWHNNSAMELSRGDINKINKLVEKEFKKQLDL
jgi:hypothetical protein